MSYFQPKKSGKKYHIFGEGGGQKLSNDCSVDFLGQIPIRENKEFDNIKNDYAPIVGKIVQKLSILASTR
jgi:hypothetical protein